MYHTTYNMYLLSSESPWEDGRQHIFQDSLEDHKNCTFFPPPKKQQKTTVKCYGNGPHIKPEEEPERQLLGAVRQLFKIKSM